MAKSYFLTFSSGDPRTLTGLAPTFLIFSSPTGTTFPGPAITEVLTSGIYTFSYGVTAPITFLADAFTTSPGNGRYVVGNIDPADRIDEYGNTLIAFGNSLIALGNTNVALGQSSGIFSLLGSTSSSFGSTSIDPTTIFGFLKRAQEMAEGNQTYTKTTGLLDFYSRGSSTLLREKTIADTTTNTTKS